MPKSKDLFLLSPHPNICRKLIPNYKGKVGQAVVDLGITHRTHNRASLNKGKGVGDTNIMIKRKSTGISCQGK
eukprot:9907478-Heterocapsa_arctica.AAC.1